MGYEIKSLSTKEIQDRVSSEKVIPSLLWLIPIGDDWGQHELETPFYKFNNPRNKTRVKLLSNFFVKGDPDAEPSKKRKKALSMSDQSNDISRLLGKLEKYKKSILIVCSNFPHPGWGIVVKVDDLESVFEKLETILTDPKFNHLVKLSEEMYDSFYILKEYKDNLQLELSKNISNSAQPNIYNEKQIELQKLQDDYYPTYKRIANDLVEEVMKFSAIALIEIERSGLLELQIIAIDQPRMIGWKIANSISSRLSTISFAEYLNRDYGADIELNEINRDDKLDGDVFTDYLHHILINNSSKYGDKRKVAEKLMCYFNYDQRREVVDFFRLTDDQKTDNSKLLNGLGWAERTHDYFDTSLISYFEKNADGNYFITNPKKESYSGLREGLESYLKDLVRIIKKHLTSDENQLNKLILSKYPNFIKPKLLTSAPLCMMIHALGPLWQHNLNWDEYNKIILSINKILNEDGRVHHNELIRREDEVVRALNPLFNDLFKFTKTIFTIMPWHFRPTSNFMSNLYTGMAWSHDVKEKKEIRVLVWENEDEIEFGEEILIWNPSKINPVMTNYIKL
jgi:hypothetical protein